MADRLSEGLETRLRGAGVDAARLFDDGASPWNVWLRLHDHWGRRATAVDLYELTAAHRGVDLGALSRRDRSQLARAVLRVHDPEFELPPGSERDSDPVEISGYDPAWPLQFTDWQSRIAVALGPVALRIEHVGSTSVPSLAAKPVIDIQVTVPDVADEDDYVPAIESVGMQLRSRETAHRYFRPPADRARDAQVHVCDPGGGWGRPHLLFRDYLRITPAARDAYAVLKRELAVRWRDDRVGYAEAKTAFILDTLDDAERWAVQTGWVH